MDLYQCRDRDGARLAAFLTASVEAQRWQTLRAWLVGWLALASAPLWALVVWPHLLGGKVRAGVLTAWVALVAVLCLAVVMEVRWHRRLEPFRARDRDEVT